MCSNVLIKPSLHNTYNNSCNYYNYSTKQHVSALFGHHKAYKTVVLVKVHSVSTVVLVKVHTVSTVVLVKVHSVSTVVLVKVHSVSTVVLVKVHSVATVMLVKVHSVATVVLVKVHSVATECTLLTPLFCKHDDGRIRPEHVA